MNFLTASKAWARRSGVGLAGCLFVTLLIGGCGSPVRLITLDPGHFHAALVQKTMYPDVDPVVHVYAPGGENAGDLEEHLKRITGFNTRATDPTHWKEEVYAGSDYLEKMISQKRGNVVVISGNNRRKTDYILQSVRSGINVLADKPMAITPKDFETLKKAFAAAEKERVLLYDIMTERFEITTRLQRALPLSRCRVSFRVYSPPSASIIAVMPFLMPASKSPFLKAGWITAWSVA